jgi:hypothetical protein
MKMRRSRADRVSMINDRCLRLEVVNTAGNQLQVLVIGFEL